jgi:hypothetical protein
MDTLNLIRNKLASIANETKRLSTGTVITHIERAEQLFDLGLRNEDSQFFTDVIYRTNHAFEGILKEAYLTLANEETADVTPNEIEKFFASRNLLHPRVLDLFTHYRRQWRNPSTHDYQLFFSEEEAYLAILSVTSFVNLLLNQIIESLSYAQHKTAHAVQPDEPVEAQPLDERVASLLILFSNPISGTREEYKSEAQLLGAISAFISGRAPEISATREPKITHEERNYYPDFVLRRGSESVVLEVKREYRQRPDTLAREQAFQYMIATRIPNVVIYFYTSRPEAEYEITRSAITDDTTQFNFTVVGPR